jgi:hypothetical protein
MARDALQRISKHQRDSIKIIPIDSISSKSIMSSIPLSEKAAAGKEDCGRAPTKERKLQSLDGDEETDIVSDNEDEEIHEYLSFAEDDQITLSQHVAPDLHFGRTIVEKSSSHVDNALQNPTVPFEISWQSEEKSGYVPPQTDLNGILLHLALLNDLKKLTDLPGHDERQRFTDHFAGSSRSRFHRMFQVKCCFLNALDNAQEETSVQRQALREQYGLNGNDLELILDHIQTAQEHCKNVRWDLVEALIFPARPFMNDTSLGTVVEDPSFQNNEPFGYCRVIPESQHGHGTYQEFAESAEPLEGEDSLSKHREEFQEVILDLFEAEEETWHQLSPDELFMRQQILIHLLWATNAEEAHLTSLSFEDVSEIVSHIQLCQDLEIPVHWCLLQNIIFPLGLDATVDTRNNWDRNDSAVQSSSKNTRSSKNYPSDAKKFSVEDDCLRDYLELTETELEIVLNHIHLCDEVGKEIRWDLLAEILFPGDPIRKEMLTNNTRSHSSSGGVPRGINQTVASRERARAILSLSNHDWELSNHDLDISESEARDIHDDSCDSFFDDSITSLL